MSDAEKHYYQLISGTTEVLKDAEYRTDAYGLYSDKELVTAEDFWNEFKRQLPLG